MCIQSDTVRSHLFMAKKRSRGLSNRMSKGAANPQPQAALPQMRRSESTPPNFPSGLRATSRRSAVPLWEEELVKPLELRTSPWTITTSKKTLSRGAKVSKCGGGVTYPQLKKAPSLTTVGKYHE